MYSMFFSQKLKKILFGMHCSTRVFYVAETCFCPCEQMFFGCMRLQKFAAPRNFAAQKVSQLLYATYIVVLLHPFQTLYQFASRVKKCAPSNINMILKAAFSSINSSNVGFYSVEPSRPNKYSKWDFKSFIFGQICSQLFLDFLANLLLFNFSTRKSHSIQKNY